ncbi:MAG: hypothetical protein ACJAY5_000349 [Actinomycetes bacterium]|jgi:hypothetical protein
MRQKFVESEEGSALAGSIADLSAQLNRTASWLNSLPLQRLERTAEGESIASSAFRISTRLLELQLELDPLSYPTNAKLTLPTVRSHGVGSQLSVVGVELLAALQATKGLMTTGAATSRPPVDREVDSRELVEQLTALTSELLALRKS